MKRSIVVGLAALFLLASACGNNGADDERGKGDSKVTAYDDTGALVLNNPDEFANVALKCLAGDLVMSHRRVGAAPAIIPNASSCRPGIAESLRIPRVAGITPAPDVVSVPTTKP